MSNIPLFNKIHDADTTVGDIKIYFKYFISNNGCTDSYLNIFFFFFQALNFLVESFGLLNDLFPLPSVLDAGCPVFDLHLADVLFDVILPSVFGSSL
jgi:hypothetical protein